MKFPIQVRGFRPRPFKRKNGDVGYYGTYVILDTSPENPIMDTMQLEREFANEGEMVKGAQLVGKSAICCADGFKVGVDGEARFVGSIEQAK